MVAQNKLLHDKLHKIIKEESYRSEIRYNQINADNEHWVPYTEKAYAKRYKTYDAITGGWGAWGLTDLTGGIAIKTSLDKREKISHYSVYK